MDSNSNSNNNGNQSRKLTQQQEKELAKVLYSQAHPTKGQSQDRYIPAECTVCGLIGNLQYIKGTHWKKKKKNDSNNTESGSISDTDIEHV